MHFKVMGSVARRARALGAIAALAPRCWLSLTLFACVPPAGPAAPVARPSPSPTAPSPPAPPAPSAPPAPPAPPDGPLVIAPTSVEAMRIAGEKDIVPDAATKRELAAAGVDKVVTSYRLCLGSDGVPTLVLMVTSSGFPAYDAKIQAQMMQWRYRPYSVDGVAKKVCTGITFVYRQHNDPRDRKPQLLVYTPAPAKLTLLSSGTGPAAPLRLTPVRGRKQYVRMTYGQDLVHTPAGQAPGPLRGVSLSLDGITEATALDERGDLRYVTAIEKSELTDAGETARDTLAGAKIEGAASTIGATSRTQVSPPPGRFTAEGLDPAHKALATWLILPRDPVGVGAQWEVVTREPWIDGEIELLTRYTLKARTATSASISGELKVLAVTFASSRQLLSFTSYGKLEATLTQGRLYPQLERALRVEVKSRERVGQISPVDVEASLTVDVHHGFSLPWLQSKP